MKKYLMATFFVLGMIVGIVVLSSFNVPKTNEEIVLLQNSDGGWRLVGEYTGTSIDGKEEKFRIWEKEGMCNAYYWVYKCADNAKKPDSNPDETSCTTGALRQNSDGKWYAACWGTQYFIDF